MFGFGRKARKNVDAAVLDAEIARVEATIVRVLKDELARDEFRTLRDRRLAACNAREAERCGE